MPQEVTNTPVERVENPPPSTDAVESSGAREKLFNEFSSTSTVRDSNPGVSTQTQFNDSAINAEGNLDFNST